MAQEMITIPKKEYEELRRQACIDTELLQQLMRSFKDVKEGRFEE